MSIPRSPFPPSYFAELSRLEASNWWFRSRNRVLMWVLGNKVSTFDTFLEVGCGTGYVLEGIRGAFPDVKLSGAEYHEEGLDFARQRIPSAHFRQLDITDTFDVDQYDCIGAFDVLEHIDDDQLSLRNLYQALKPNGKLVISVPQHAWLWSAADDAACHVRRYSKSNLVGKLRSAGFKVDYATSFVSLLLPLMFFSRRYSKSLKENPLSELKVPKLLDCFLDVFMKFELMLIRSGFSFPVGGSLLVVASKP